MDDDCFKELLELNGCVCGFEACFLLCNLCNLSRIETGLAFFSIHKYLCGIRHLKVCCSSFVDMSMLKQFEDANRKKHLCFWNLFFYYEIWYDVFTANIALYICLFKAIHDQRCPMFCLFNVQEYYTSNGSKKKECYWLRNELSKLMIYSISYAGDSKC